MGVIKFFHQLFRPNCSCNICSAPVCEKCEILGIQLNYERQVNQELIRNLIQLTAPEKEQIPSEKVEHKPIVQHIPWRVKQQMLENEDKQAAKLKRDMELEQAAHKEANQKPLTIEELEKELELPEGA
jgi:hypothetical protein